jgi:hypothetical protein
MFLAKCLQNINMKNTLLMAALIAMLFTAVMIGCTKSNSGSGTTQLAIRLADTPYNAEEVNVDIREVRVHFSDDSTAAWHTLPTTAGIYNLLNFQNGIDTVIATGPVPTGILKELRFVLGPNNSIKISNQVYPLTVPIGETSGLKIKVNKNLAATLDSLLIDFDANASIHETGNGKYMLKPVIKLK